MHRSIIIRVVGFFLTPFIQLYAFYVLAHGELGPGGGFQAGVIFASAAILYTLIFDLNSAKDRFSKKVFYLLNSGGLFIFGAFGVLCLIGGGAFLEYYALPLEDDIASAHLGIYGVEIGVGITVASAMTLIFFEMVRRDDD